MSDDDTSEPPQAGAEMQPRQGSQVVPERRNFLISLILGIIITIVIVYAVKMLIYFWAYSQFCGPRGCI
jgi:hypothetical protein